MSEERLERIEQLIVQLIQMVAENNKIVKSLEKRMDNLEQRMDNLERRMDSQAQRFDTESKLNQQRHHDVMKEIRNLIFEVDYLRDQSSKHDMEIHKLKQAQS